MPKERTVDKIEEILSQQPGPQVSVLRQDLEDFQTLNAELQRRLEEAEQTIDAIRYGEIDAIVRSDTDGTKIYTLEGPDRPYQKIVETLNAGAVTVDQRGVVFYSNNSFAEMTGVPLESLIGSSFIELIVAEDQPLFSSLLSKARVKKATEEVRLRGSNGELFVKLAATTESVNGVERTSIVITDISELKLAEQSLARQTFRAEYERDRLMALLDNMNEGVWFAYPDGRLALTNAVAKAHALQVGLNPDTLLQTPWSSLLDQIELLTPDEKPMRRDALLRAFEGEPICGLELAIRNLSTGDIFYRRVSANPIFDSKKQVDGVIVVDEDATAEKRAEIARTHLEEQLRQAQKMEAIGTLAGGIAHNFNNMLAVVLGNAELALDDIDENQGPAHNIEQIIQASKRARDLVKQILTFSRKTETGKKPLHLTSLVEETFKLLRGTLPSTIQMDFRVETESDSLVANPSQIQQILMNLATNAAHAMRENGGALTIRIGDATLKKGFLPDPDMKPGSYVTVMLQDTGTGMTKEVLSRIFEPFFTTKESDQGTGMGLAVVYGIVKSHGGAITAMSEPGKGSTFIVYLPKAKAKAKEEAKEAGALPSGNERILLIDDEPTVLEMTSSILNRHGYTVTGRDNPAEALALFRADPYRFDLVITDQTMPKITGVSLAAEIQKERKDIPIILFTGYSETVSPEKAKQAGISEFVMKPVVRQEIAATIRQVLDSSKKAQSQAPNEEK